MLCVSLPYRGSIRAYVASLRDNNKMKILRSPIVKVSSFLLGFSIAIILIYFEYCSIIVVCVHIIEFDLISEG